MSNPYGLADDLEKADFERDQAERLAFAIWWIETVSPLSHRHLRALFSEVFTAEQVERLVYVFIIAQKEGIAD